MNKGDPTDDFWISCLAVFGQQTKFYHSDLSIEYMLKGFNLLKATYENVPRVILKSCINKIWLSELRINNSHNLFLSVCHLLHLSIIRIQLRSQKGSGPNVHNCKFRPKCFQCRRQKPICAIYKVYCCIQGDIN